MPKIKIEDLAKDMKISEEEMKKVLGGSSAAGINALGLTGAGGIMLESSPAMAYEIGGATHKDSWRGE